MEKSNQRARPLNPSGDGGMGKTDEGYTQIRGDPGDAPRTRLWLRAHA
ncbi:hypothetical protein [Achromobacter aegrifaciens]